MLIPKELIIEAKNKLGDKAAYRIAEYFKMEDFNEQNLKGCCFKHSERTPSMHWNSKNNSFHCFGCNVSYGILDLYMEQGLTYLDATKKLFEEVDMDTHDLKFKSNVDNENYFKDYKYPIEESNDKRDKVEAYLARRGISKTTLDFAGIKQDKSGNIVFEHKDVNGVLLCVKYRPARALKKGDKNNKKEAMMWWQSNSSNCPILYGVNTIDITKPLIICEGHIDRLSIIESGHTNVVSIPHGAVEFNWVEFNYSFLELFEEIILYFDNDQVGEAAIKEILSRLGEYRCKIVKPTKEHEEQVHQYYKKINQKLNINKTDANNILITCGKEELSKLISNATEIEDSEIKDLMSYDYYNNQNREKYPTGIKALDRIIGGHLLRCLTLYTGYTGEGKSTAINQIALKPFMENKEKVFIFSGEMGGDKLMSWLLDSVASERHMIEWDNGLDAPKGYSVSKQAIEAIKKFYMGNIHNYDKKGVVSTDDLFKKMEYCRKKYGIKHFFIDKDRKSVV